jgi:hypothetical protein
MKMEQTERTETFDFKLQTPVTHSEEHTGQVYSRYREYVTERTIRGLNPEVIKDFIILHLSIPSQATT